MSKLGETSWAFVNYDAPGWISQRNRELKQAQIRSHAARSSRRPSPPQTTYKPWEVSFEGVPYSPLLESPPEMYSLLKTSEPRCRICMARVRRNSRSCNHLADVILHRTKDWNFGSLGPTCRPIDNLDMAVIEWYLKNSVRIAWPSSVGPAPTHEQSLAMNRLLFPMISEAVQRATGELPFLESLVCATIFRMGEGCPLKSKLATLGHEAAYRATKALRASLQKKGAEQDIHVLMSVMYLGLAAIRLGDIQGADAHLSFLARNIRTFDNPGQFHYMYNSGMTLLDIRFALETGQRPRVRPLEQHGHVLGNGLEVDWTPDSAKHDRWAERGRGKGYAGFVLALRDGVLSPVMQDVVELSIDAMDSIVEVLSGEARLTTELYQDKYLRTLQAICTLQYDLRKSHASQHDCESLPNFDEPVLLALQIHVAVILWRFIKPALRKILDRLQRSLQNIRNLNISKRQWTLGIFQSTELWDKLYLWLVVTGVFVAREASNYHQWFEEESLRVVRSMRIVTESQMEISMASFISAKAVGSTGFMKIARELVRQA